MGFLLENKSGDSSTPPFVTQDLDFSPLSSAFVTFRHILDLTKQFEVLLSLPIQLKCVHFGVLRSAEGSRPRIPTPSDP